jgi:hypothetical protein
VAWAKAPAILNPFDELLLLEKEEGTFSLDRLSPQPGLGLMLK